MDARAPHQAEMLPVQREGDLRSIAFVLVRRIRVIIGMAAAILLLTLFVLFTIVPRYTASAQIMLDPRRPTLAGAEALLPDMPFDQTMIDNQIALIQSRSLLARVVESEQLLGDDEFGYGVTPSPLARLRSLLSGTSADGETPAEAPSGTNAPNRNPVRSADALRGSLTVERVGRTYILSIGVTSRDPQKAARLANAVANAYIVDQLEARFDAARRASAWLGERLEKLREELRDSESAISDYRARHNLTAAVSGAVSEAQVADLNGRLAASRAETVERRAKLEQAQRIINEGGNPQAIPSVVQSPVMGNLKTQQAEISRREADLIARYGDRHPSVVNVRAERQDVDRQIRVEVTRVLANLRNDFDVAKTRQESLEQSLGLITGQGGVDNAVAVRLRELERIASANKTLYESFLSKFKLSEEQANLEVREARVISTATVPGSPSYPRRGLIASLALVFGLASGVGTAFLLETLRRGFATPGEIEQLLELPTLASVPLMTAKELSVNGKAMLPAQVVLKSPLSRFSEAIRSVRAGIQMSDVDEPPRVVQVSSVASGEGKTTVSISLAFSAATTYPHVLLVDCDLRRPGVTKAFGLEKRPGLVDLLVGTSSLQELISRDPASGIHILGAGSTTQNPPDLLSSNRMRAFLDEVRKSYDYVVLDSPPAGPVVDALVLAQLADKVAFVVLWNDTPREMVARTLKQLEIEKKVAGVVLNRVDTKQSTRYAGYYYSRYYNNYYETSNTNRR